MVLTEKDSIEAKTGTYTTMIIKTNEVALKFKKKKKKEKAEEFLPFKESV